MKKIVEADKRMIRMITLDLPQISEAASLCTQMSAHIKKGNKLNAALKNWFKIKDED